MNMSKRKIYQRAAMTRVNIFLSNNLKEIPRKQNQKIREFARLNSLTIPINKDNLTWLIDIYLSGENKNCSQKETIEKNYKPKIKYKKTSQYDDELLESARILDAILESGDSKYIKYDFVEAYLTRYRGYEQDDLNKLKVHVHTDDLKSFLKTSDVRHATYLKSLKWHQIKGYVRERDNYTCSNCGMNMVDDLYHLHTHHLTYKRLGNEDPQDLVLLCSKCHSKEHSKNKPT